MNRRTDGWIAGRIDRWIERYIDRQTDRQVDGHGEAVVMKLESGFPEAAFQIPSLHARSAEESR